MQTTHKRRALKQTADLWKRNLVVLLLAWGVAGTIAVAAASEECAVVEMGLFGWILVNVILRTDTLVVVAGFGVFYMSASLIFYFTGYKSKMRNAQRVFFQPIFAPTMFVVAGYFLGVPAAHMNDIGYLWAVGLAVVVLLLATVVTSIYELMEA